MPSSVGPEIDRGPNSSGAAIHAVMQSSSEQPIANLSSIRRFSPVSSSNSQTSPSQSWKSPARQLNYAKVRTLTPPATGSVNSESYDAYLSPESLKQCLFSEDVDMGSSDHAGASPGQPLDSCRPTPEMVQVMLQKTYSLWSSYVPPSTGSRIPRHCHNLESILGRTPAFPDLSSGTTGSILSFEPFVGRCCISGQSNWITSTDVCDLPPRRFLHKLPCGMRKSVRCTFATNTWVQDWPGIQGQSDRIINGNHVGILVLVWSYILSARLMELLSPQCSAHCSSRMQATASIQYSSLQANRSTCSNDDPEDSIEVYIGNTEERVARWWAAILAPGLGWTTTLDFPEGKISHSPWSAHVDPQYTFLLRTGTMDVSEDDSMFNEEDSQVPPTSAEALDYLRQYCELHDIGSQCIPSLAAALYIPLKNGGHGGGHGNKPLEFSLTLPMPKDTGYPPTDSRAPTPLLRRSIYEQYLLLPYYLTLTCEPQSTTSLLRGTFFDPSVPCNLVSAWELPISKVLDPILRRGDVIMFLTVMNNRQPRLATLWLGAALIGLHEVMVQRSRGDSSHPSIHLSAWTGIPLAFGHDESCIPSINSNSEMSRFDEFKLLLILPLPDEPDPLADWNAVQPRPPIWGPFGTTPFRLAGLDVQIHANCGHFLRYSSWQWENLDGLSREDKGLNDDLACLWNLPLVLDHEETTPTLLELPTDADQASEYATKRIFMWARHSFVFGSPPTEKGIFEHEWFASWMQEANPSDDEEEDDASVSDVGSLGGHNTGEDMDEDNEEEEEDQGSQRDYVQEWLREVEIIPGAVGATGF